MLAKNVVQLLFHVFYSARDFFVTTMNHWASLRVAQVAASSFDHVTSFRIVIATLWAFEAPFGWGEVAFVATFVTVIDWGIGSKVANRIVGIIPNGF